MPLRRWLVPALLCIGMATIPLLALRSGRGTHDTLVSAHSGRGRLLLDAAMPSFTRGQLEGAFWSAPAAAVVPAPIPSAVVASAAPAVPAVTPTIVRAAPRASARTAPRSAPTHPKPTPTTTTAPGHSQTGAASWYRAPAGTCAHQSIPFGTVVTVTDLDNGRQVTCTVEDRGPYQDGRILDLSETTFSQLAPPGSGVIDVRITW